MRGEEGRGKGVRGREGVREGVRSDLSRCSRRSKSRHEMRQLYAQCQSIELFL